MSLQQTFRINLTNPMAKTAEYLDVLRKVNYPKLSLEFDNYKQFAFTPKHPSLLERVHRFTKLNDNELRTLHYCSYIHPKEYSQSGDSAPNWYDINELRVRLWEGQPLYLDQTGHLKTHLKQQKSFIYKVQNAKPAFVLGEDSLERYEQFMSLVKKYGHEKRLSPPLDVDMVWHAHMLHHSAYVEATKEYFGYILDHDDSKKSDAQLLAQKDETARLWAKHYGKRPSSSSDCSIVLPYFTTDYIMHGFNSSKCVSGSSYTHPDTDSSCSSCSSCD